MRTASCSCGQLKVHCDGEPVRLSMCHCLACQKRTGSIFGVQARWHAKDVRIEGEGSTWSRTGDSGGTATFRFCATCGAHVYWTFEGFPEWVATPVGAFADSSFPPPTIEVYAERRHPWALMPGLAVETQQ